MPMGGQLIQNKVALKHPDALLVDGILMQVEFLLVWYVDGGSILVSLNYLLGHYFMMKFIY